MLIWNEIVGVLRESMFAYAQVCNGNLGAGILAVTFLARLAMLPVALRLAQSAYVHQQAMRKVQPQLDRLRAEHKADPRRLAEETNRMLAREGISPLPLAGCLGSLAQAPVLIALYTAVRSVAAAGGRFLWIGNLALPDFLLAGIASLLALAATATGTATTANRTPMLVASGIVTALVLSKTAAGVSLYWALSSLFGAFQGLVVQRRLRGASA